MADDPWAGVVSDTPPPKPGPDWSGLSSTPPAEDTSIPPAVQFQMHRGQNHDTAVNDVPPVSTSMQSWAAEQFKKGNYASGIAAGLASVPLKIGEMTADFPAGVVKGAIDFATLPDDVASGKVKTAEELIPRTFNAASFVAGGDILGHIGETPLVPTKTGDLARIVQDDQGRPTTRVIGPPPVEQDFQTAAKAIDPTGGLTPPAAEVKPSPIKAIEGSPFAGVPRSIAAKTGIPEVDRVVSDLRGILDNPVVDRTRDIPNSWGGSEPITNPTTYLDHQFPKELTVGNVTFDPAEPAVLHENVEEAVIDILKAGGMAQDTALSVAYHGFGNPVEHAWYRAHGMDPAAVEKVLRPILDKIATEKGPNIPADLFRRTYPENNPQLASAGDVPKPTPEEAAKGMQIVRDYQAANPPRTVADKLKDGWQTYGVHPYEAAEKASQPVVAYHGSPHDFDAFSTAKIGTGEGAQSYGHGLYFAEHPDVAKSYGGPEARYDDKGIPGAHYQVKIHANKDDFLDWDKPLSEQSPRVQKALNKLGITDLTNTGEEAYTRMGKNSGKEKAQISADLTNAGIPGIKYLDQGSRMVQERPRNTPGGWQVAWNTPNTKTFAWKDYGGSQGAYDAGVIYAKELVEKNLTRNLVVFDHNIVEITHKNGTPIPSNHLSPMARDLSSARTPARPLPPRPSKNFIQDTDNNLFRIRQAHVADQSEMLNLIDKLPSSVKNAELQEKWYRYGEGDTSVHLTPEEGKAYNETMIPLQKEQRQLWEEAKKTELPVEEYNPYMHRVVVGKTPQIDRFAGEGAGEANPIYNGPGILARSTSSMHERKFFALEDESGNRQLITMKDIQHLSETTDVPLKVGDVINAEQKYTIRQALTREIEENSDVRYYKNALVNTIDNILHLRAVNRAIFEIQKLRDTPEWAKYTTSSYGNDVMKKGWIQPKMPLFQNDFMDPKLAHVLDDFYGRVPIDGLQATLEKINHYATGSMFWTPVPHAKNAGQMWATERGWDNITPKGMQSLVVDGAAAIRHVVTQSTKYQQLLREGAGLQYARVVNQNFYQKLLQRAGMELPKDEQSWGDVAKIVGQSPINLVKNIYNAASNSLWAVSDMFGVQRVLELERKGMNTREAIDASEKIMANYRVPSEILGSRSLQQAYTNPLWFMFSRYHYNVMKGFANMAKDLAVGDAKQKFDTIGRIMAMGVFQLALWPLESQMLTAGYKTLTGDNTTKIKAPPAGFGKIITPIVGSAVNADPKDFPKYIQDYYHNDDGLMRQLMNLIPMSPLLKWGIETGMNKYSYSGKPIAEPSDVRQGRYGRVAGQEAEHTAGSLVEPYSTISQAMKQGASIPQKIIEGAFGLQEHTDKQEEARAKAFHYQDKEAARRKPQGLIEGLTK